MNMKVEKITKDDAQKLLSSSNGNRPINKQILFKLKKHLLNGTWETCLSDIMVDENDILIGGHHQLTAIYQTGVAAECIVKRGVPHSVKAKTNVCKSSSPNDAWLLSEHQPLKSQERCWAALKFILNVEVAIRDNAEKISHGNCYEFCNEEMIERMEKLQDKITKAVPVALKMVREICAFTPGRGEIVGTSAPIAGAMVLLGESCNKFVADVMSGTIMSGTSCDFFRTFIRNTKKGTILERGIGFILAVADSNTSCDRKQAYDVKKIMLPSPTKKVLELVKTVWRV